MISDHIVSKAIMAKYYFEVLEKLSMVLIERVQSPAFAGRLLESCFSADR
jgi:hypothetical protein